MALDHLKMVEDPNSEEEEFFSEGQSLDEKKPESTDENQWDFMQGSKIKEPEPEGQDEEERSDEEFIIPVDTDDLATTKSGKEPEATGSQDEEEGSDADQVGWVEHLWEKKLEIFLLVVVVGFMYFFYFGGESETEKSPEEQDIAAASVYPKLDFPRLTDRKYDVDDLNDIARKALEEKNRNKTAKIIEDNTRKKKEYEEAYKAGKANSDKTREELLATIEVLKARLDRLEGNKVKRRKPPRGKTPKRKLTSQKELADSTENFRGFRQRKILSSSSFYKAGGTIETQRKYKQEDNQSMQPGKVFAAKLMTGVSSEMRSEVMARISKGDKKLLPAGTVIYGRASGTKRRMMIDFTRATKPDGEKLRFSAQAMYKGMPGIPARVAGSGRNGTSGGSRVIKEGLKDTARSASGLIPGSGIVGDLARNIASSGVNEAARGDGSYSYSKTHLELTNGTAFDVITKGD